MKSSLGIFSSILERDCCINLDQYSCAYFKADIDCRIKYHHSLIVILSSKELIQSMIIKFHELIRTQEVICLIKYWFNILAFLDPILVNFEHGFCGEVVLIKNVKESLIII